MLHAPLALLAGLFAVSLLTVSPKGNWAAADLVSRAYAGDLTSPR